jgi:hypothetical protein
MQAGQQPACTQREGRLSDLVISITLWMMRVRVVKHARLGGVRGWGVRKKGGRMRMRRKSVQKENKTEVQSWCSENVKTAHRLYF